MKLNAAKLLALLLACFSAGAADISFNLQDFQTGPIGTKRVSIFPLMTPTVSGSAVITSDRIAYTTAADGTFTATNMVPGTYRVEVLGPYGATTFYIVTGETNANAIDLTTAATNLVSGFTAYPTTQSDNRYTLKTNGTAYGLRFPSGAVSNYVWTCTNAATGQGAWVEASGGSSTNGGTVTSLSVTSQTLTVTGSPVTTAGTITLEVPTSLTNGFVRSDVTNGLASIGYVNAATNGFVYASVTNGLASQGYAQSLTNGFLRTNEIQAGSNVSITYDAQNRPVISSTATGGVGGASATNGIVYEQQFFPILPIASSTNIFIDMATNVMQELVLNLPTGSRYNFWTTNRHVYTSGVCTAVLKLSTTSTNAVAFNVNTSWHALGAPVPTDIGTNKWAFMSVTLWGGSSETNIAFSYAPQN